MKNKVYAVIVTYNDRFKYVSQLIESLLSQQVDKIIIIDNNSTPQSRTQLKEFFYNMKLDNKCNVIYLDDNYGSSGGFKIGLEYAYNDMECDFIWLLDDDNLPEEKSLQNLMQFWNALKYNEKEKKIALLSLRKNRDIYKKALSNNDPNIVLGRANSFYGIHVYELLKILFAPIVYFKRRKADEEFVNKYCEIKVASYGGLFFNKKIIDTIGFPDERLFVYYDDHEWTYRITKNSGKIFLVSDSIVKDIEDSWDVYKGSRYIEKIKKASNFRLYYSIRNRIYFINKYLLTNKIIYNINKAIFIIIIFIFAHNKYSIIQRAINDGESSILGKIQNLQL